MSALTNGLRARASALSSTRTYLHTATSVKYPTYLACKTVAQSTMSRPEKKQRTEDYVLYYVRPLRIL